MTLKPSLLLVAVALVLAGFTGCDSSTESSPPPPDAGADLSRAVSIFNGGFGPITLRDLINGAGGYNRCGFSLERNEAILTVVARDESWFQATVDLETREVEQNFGADFESAIDGESADSYFENTQLCTVSENGTVQLD